MSAKAPSKAAPGATVPIRGRLPDANKAKIVGMAAVHNPIMRSLAVLQIGIDFPYESGIYNANWQ
jgi:hypothetical protein